MTKKICIFTFIFYLAIITGCQTVDRGYENIVAVTNPDRVKLNTTLKWLHPQSRMNPSSSRMIYLRVRNSAGVDINFVDPIADEVMLGGYIIIYDPSQADYILDVDIRHLGERALKSGDAAIAGAAGGAVVGGVIGHNTKMGTGPGAVVGGILGVLVGNTVAQRNKDREYIFTVDVNIGERVEGGVDTSKITSDDTSLGNRAGGSGEFGGSNSSTSVQQSYDRKEDFIYYQNRVIISAKSLNLELYDAVPVLINRASMAIASTLP